LAFIYNFENQGPCIVIRCELDALPIEEHNNFAHKSINPGVSHKCGHDGHMTILAGLGEWISSNEFESGKVILLYQPSEENGKGGDLVLKNKWFASLKVDYMFALHNLPGYPLHTIAIKEGNFSASVQSFILKFKGIEAHASTPELGCNPALAIADVINKLDTLCVSDPQNTAFKLLTPIFINHGQQSYGIAPGKGEIHYTIRAYSMVEMDSMVKRINGIVKNIADNHSLKYDISYFEFFPSTFNNPECVEFVKNAAEEMKLDLDNMPTPLKFGEDFGWFSQRFKSAIFGLGAGLDAKPLHNPEYDFPDELTKTGIDIFKNIIYQILENK